jgi:hypothetical protein
MFIAIALMLMPPPLPPPDPARLAEAVAIWRDHPLHAGYMREYALASVRERIAFMLTTARVRQSSRQLAGEIPDPGRLFPDSNLPRSSGQ